MQLNDIILKLANCLASNDECSGADFTLTLNFDNVLKHKYVTINNVSELQYNHLDKDGIKLIENELSKKDVKNFNLTLIFDNKTYKPDYEGYETGWYDCKYIFHGGNKIQVVFDMLSDFKGMREDEFNRYLGDVVLTEDTMDEIIIKLVDLKNILMDNGDRVINHLNTFKNVNK